MIALATPALFDGETRRGPACVVIDGEHIGSVLAVPPEGVALESLPPVAMLVPGFIDIQVNGGDGVLFNDTPTLDGLRHIAETHARLGTTSLLPTLVSAGRPLREAGIAAVRAALAEGVPGIAGIHVEGPFISPRRRGIHPESAITAPTDDDLALIADAPHACLLTVAPEVVSPARIARLAAAGVTVSLGHSDADAETAAKALAAGARGFTHLFNAMSQLGSRAPGVVGAALDSGAAFAGIIVDGLHVHPASVRLAWRLLGPARLVLISDAMPSIGTEPPRGFLLNGHRITLADGKLTDDAGTLAGAHLSMAGAVRHAITQVGLPPTDALRMATATPAAHLGLRDRGRIAPGLRADLVALDADWRVVAVWQAGRRVA